MSSKTVCFFAKTKDREVLSRNEFYAQDIRILEDLGYNVRIATSPAQIRAADLYFVWWWTWAFFPVLAASVLKRPSIITGTFNGWQFPSRPALHRRMIQFALARASANLFVSQLEYEQTQKLAKVNNPSYSPHTVDTQLYSPVNNKRDELIFTVAWMHGYNAERKCIPEIVKAIPLIRRDHPSARLVIAGDKGTYYPRLEELVRDLGVGDCVEFPGVISREQKIDYLQRCKIYLQPSRYEGFGLAILEAMSCGAPVITSRVGAVPEVVGDAGLYVDGTSPEEIACAVNRLWEQDDLRERLGREARSRAELFFGYERRRLDIQRIIDEIS